MAEFLCPNCRGGFDRPVYEGDDGYCPWCHQELNGSYEPPETPVVSKTVSDDEPSSGLIETLFK